MGTGYSRNDTSNNIADGNIINASDLDGEFDAVQAAFNASTGHTHDGTTAEGAPITVTGPAQEYVSTGTELRPKTNNTYDLGSLSLQWKDLYVDGTGYIDSVDIDGGAIDGTTIGGSVAAAGTFTNLTATGTTTLAGASTTADITFGDNDKAIFGAGSDLQIFHSGAASYIIEGGTGELILQSDGSNIAMFDGVGYMLRANNSGSVQLYYNRAEKLATTATGIAVTGDATFGDNGRAIFGAGSDLQIYHTGAHSYIDDQGTGNLYLNSNGSGTIIQGGGTQARFFNGAGVDLWYNNAIKLATTSTGVDVTGTVTANGLTVGGTEAAFGGASGEYKIIIEGSAAPRQNYIGMTGYDSLVIAADEDNLGTASDIQFRVDAKQVAAFSAGGDISFYEDTGTTPEFFWDASAEALGIGTSSPSGLLTLNNSSASAQLYIRSGDTNDSAIIFGRQNDIATGSIGYYHSDDSLRFNGYNNQERMRITSTGSVGIGTTSPDRQFQVESSGTATFALATTNYSASGDPEYSFGEFDFLTDDKLSGLTAPVTIARIAARANTASTVPGGELAFYTNGYGVSQTQQPVERMRIDSSGNVGIGTSSPSFALDVQGATDPSIRVRATGTTSADDALIRMQIAGTTANNIIQFGDSADSDAGYISYDHASDYLAVGVNAAERMRITSDGSVGIGVTSPSAPLDVVGSPGTLAEFRDGVAANFIVETSSNVTTIGNQAGSSQLAFKSSNSEAMRIDSSGNVGIGTDAPTGDLDIYRATSDPDIRLTRGTTQSRIATSSAGGLRFQADFGNTAADSFIQFSVDGSEAARIDASGNLLVGKTAAGIGSLGLEADSNGYTKITRQSATANVNTVLLLNRLSSDGEIARFAKDGTTVGSIGTAGGDLYLTSTGGVAYYIYNGSISPGTDNARDLGTASFRWDDVYATNGTIQTSDRNEKQDIDVLSDAEQRVAVAAKGLLRKFRWKDAVAEKGDDARIHFGIIAQDLQAAFAAEGLDAGKYAMFIHTTWTDEETGEERSRMGVRYSELLAFIIAAL